MEVNQEAFQDFWYWIQERHSIYLKRQAGEPKPWTNDPILQQWKFCNPFRVNDKQTVWLLENVIGPHWDDDPGLIVFNIFAFRAFNFNETFEEITSCENWFKEFYPKQVQDILKTIEDRGKNITSGAYMIRGREGMPKRESIALTLNEIWRDKDYFRKFNKFELMQTTYEYLLECNYWGWGPFTCYQVVLDLTYTKILNQVTDINDFCVFGPGAEKGLKEIWPDIKSASYGSAARGLWQLQDEYLPEWVPFMTLQDIEFSLCELSKYRRIKAGGHGKERYNGI